MNQPTKTIHIDPGSEAGRILKEADDSPVEIEVNGARYLLARLHDATESDDDSKQPDSILNIIGIGASDEPTDIAQHKHRYLAEAVDDKRSS